MILIVFGFNDDIILTIILKLQLFTKLSLHFFQLLFYVTYTLHNFKPSSKNYNYLQNYHYTFFNYYFLLPIDCKICTTEEKKS